MHKAEYSYSLFVYLFRVFSSNSKYTVYRRWYRFYLTSDGGFFIYSRELSKSETITFLTKSSLNKYRNS